MVTVPLSDRQSTIGDIAASIEIPATPVDEKEGGYFSLEPKEVTDTTPKNENAIKLDVSPQEDRSNSTDTLSELSSPSGSDGVDWEKLDKTEEQEPRTDASDEVGIVQSSKT